MLQERHCLVSFRLSRDGAIDEASEEEVAVYPGDLSARLRCRNCGVVARGEWWRDEDGKLRFRLFSWKDGFDPGSFCRPAAPAKRPRLYPARLPFGTSR
jgi:hypothetical protein